MGFLCKIKEDKYLDNNLDRDLGLSNIYNVNSTTNFCFEPFEGPTYWVSGATKAITGSTTPCSGSPTNCYSVYNFSEVLDFDLGFNFTGSTDYTGYTGSFCYKMYNRANFVVNNANKPLNNVIPSYEKCYEFSTLTSTTLNNVITLGDLPFTNSDYMLRSYYKFTPKDCIKKEIDTWKNSIQLNNFNFNYDWYLTTVTNPDSPIIIDTPSDLVNNVRLYQEKIQGSAYQNFFNLAVQPLDNRINLYVNGILLTQDLDYTLDSSTFPTTTPIVNILSGNIENRDIISIVYLIGPQSFLTALGVSRQDKFNIDTLLVTGFTENVTASTVNIVNNNTTKGTQEVFLTSNFDSDSTIVGVINGVKLMAGIEFYESSTTPNKIIFNPHFITIKEGDILSFWYFKTRLDTYNNLGTLDKDSVTIPWKVTPLREPTYNTGSFKVEVTEKSDTNWTSLFTTKYVLYDINLIQYNTEITKLEVNKDYKFRVIFEKTYKNILKENIITSSNVVGYFNTKNDKIIYSY
jgi:hypothetical protein